MTTVGEFWDKRKTEACEEAVKKNMKKENLSPDIIARATGLSFEEIDEIQG